MDYLRNLRCIRRRFASCSSQLDSNGITAIKKAPDMQACRSFSNVCIPQIILSLRKLRCTSRAFKTVFLTLFHTRVTCQIAGFLEDRTILFVCLAQGAGDTVTDRACLACEAAAFDGNVDIKLTGCVGRLERLTDDNFQCLKSKIIFDVTLVDCDLAFAGCQVYACDRFLSSACSVEHIFFCHDYILLTPVSALQASEPLACAPGLRKHEVSSASVFRGVPSGACP